VLGALFGTTHSNTSVSELFLFLTPHVVQSDDDVDRLREGVEQRLELLKQEIEKAPPIKPAAEPQP
jgi:type II secretory pathway component GspD/PulD (secretin)